MGTNIARLRLLRQWHLAFRPGAVQPHSPQPAVAGNYTNKESKPNTQPCAATRFHDGARKLPLHEHSRNWHFSVRYFWHLHQNHSHKRTEQISGIQQYFILQQHTRSAQRLQHQNITRKHHQFTHQQLQRFTHREIKTLPASQRQSFGISVPRKLIKQTF